MIKQLKHYGFIKTFKIQTVLFRQLGLKYWLRYKKWCWTAKIYNIKQKIKKLIRKKTEHEPFIIPHHINCRCSFIPFIPNYTNSEYFFQEGDPIISTGDSKKVTPLPEMSNDQK